MTYCPVCIKSSMTGATSGTGTSFPSRTTELVPDFVLVFVGLVLFKLLIYMSYVQRCRLRFLRKNDVLLAFGFMISLCYLYLFTCTVVQHHFHIRWYSCSITVTRGMPLVEKELFLQHLSSSPYLVGSVLLYHSLSVSCFVEHWLSLVFWPLYCLSFFNLRFLIISLVSSKVSLPNFVNLASFLLVQIIEKYFETRQAKGIYRKTIIG